MAVRLRLTRIGGRKNPIWRVVVADQRAKRDGRVIETVGHYNAQTEPSTIVLELSVDEDDYGSVIGRGGRTASALRTVVKVAAVKEQRRVFVDIVDD